MLARDGVLLGWRWVFLKGNWLRRAARIGVDGGVELSKGRLSLFIAQKSASVMGRVLLLGGNPLHRSDAKVQHPLCEVADMRALVASFIWGKGAELGKFHALK